MELRFPTSTGLHCWWSWNLQRRLYFVTPYSPYFLCQCCMYTEPPNVLCYLNQIISLLCGWLYSLYCIELAALYRKCISTGDWSKCVERVGILLSCHQLMKTMMIFDQNHYHLNLMMKKMGTIPLIIKQQGVETDQLAADIYPNSIPGTPKYFTTYISPYIQTLYKFIQI